MDNSILNVRNDLQNKFGVERTPDEVHDAVAKVRKLIDTIDIDVYRYLRDLNHADFIIVSKHYNYDNVDDFLKNRDLVLLIGEYKYPDEPVRRDKPIAKIKLI